MENIITLENGDTLIKSNCSLSEIYDWLSYKPTDFEKILCLHNEKLKEIQQQKESLKNFAESLVEDINNIIQYYIEHNNCIVLSRESQVPVNNVVLAKFGDYDLFYIAPDTDSDYFYKIKDINRDPHEIFRELFTVYKKIETI